MARLRGRGLGAGMAMGTAAVVRSRGGIPLLPEVPARVAEQIAARRGFEPPDVILVAEDYASALTLAGALKWGNVVGIATTHAAPDAPICAYPAVVDVPDLMEAVEDDALMLVDAERGIVLADPDGVAIMLYQAEHQNLAPKRRFHLEEVHVAAQTLDGRTVYVLSELSPEAVREGADALYTSLSREALPFGTDEAGQIRLLRDAVQTAAGKPLLVSDDYSLPLQAVLQAAALCDLTLALPPRDDLEGLGLAEIQQELREAEADCLEKDLAYALPRIAAELVYRTPESWPAEPQDDIARIEALAAQGATRVLLFPVLFTSSYLARLEAMTNAAAINLLPVVVYLGEATLPEADTETAVQTLVGAGVTGILTYGAMVGRIKDLIREANYAECRERLWQALKAEEAS